MKKQEAAFSGQDEAALWRRIERLRQLGTQMLEQRDERVTRLRLEMAAPEELEVFDEVVFGQYPWLRDYEDAIGVCWKAHFALVEAACANHPDSINVAHMTKEVFWDQIVWRYVHAKRHRLSEKDLQEQLEQYGLQPASDRPRPRSRPTKTWAAIFRRLFRGLFR